MIKNTISVLKKHQITFLSFYLLYSEMKINKYYFIHKSEAAQEIR